MFDPVWSHLTSLEQKSADIGFRASKSQYFTGKSYLCQIWGLRPKKREMDKDSGSNTPEEGSSTGKKRKAEVTIVTFIKIWYFCLRLKT